MFSQEEYKATKTIAKFLIPFIGGSVTVPIMAALSVLPEDLSTLEATWPMVVVAAASGFVPAVQNFFKHF